MVPTKRGCESELSNVGVWGLTGVAERNPIAADFADKILRHLPILRENPYNLHAAADHLESWVLGSLPRAPLLDVTGCLALRLR